MFSFKKNWLKIGDLCFRKQTSQQQLLHAKFILFIYIMIEFATLKLKSLLILYIFQL